MFHINIHLVSSLGLPVFQLKRFYYYYFQGLTKSEAVLAKAQLRWSTLAAVPSAFRRLCQVVVHLLPILVYITRVVLVGIRFQSPHDHVLTRFLLFGGVCLLHTRSRLVTLDHHTNSFTRISRCEGIWYLYGPLSSTSDRESVRCVESNQWPGKVTISEQTRCAFLLRDFLCPKDKLTTLW